jgi:hypothetical protein
MTWGEKFLLSGGKGQIATAVTAAVREKRAVSKYLRGKLTRCDAVV